MHTEWWNEPEMSEDERALERREHQLRAMENGHTITCTVYGFLGHSLKQDCAIIQSH